MFRSVVIYVFDLALRTINLITLDLKANIDVCYHPCSQHFSYLILLISVFDYKPTGSPGMKWIRCPSVWWLSACGKQRSTCWWRHFIREKIIIYLKSSYVSWILHVLLFFPLCTSVDSIWCLVRKFEYMSHCLYCSVLSLWRSSTLHTLAHSPSSSDTLSF